MKEILLKLTILSATKKKIIDILPWVKRNLIVHSFIVILKYMYCIVNFFLIILHFCHQEQKQCVMVEIRSEF